MTDLQCQPGAEAHMVAGVEAPVSRTGTIVCKGITAQKSQHGMRSHSVGNMKQRCH